MLWKSVLINWGMSCNYFLVMQLELPRKTVCSCSSLFSLCLISSPPFFFLSWCQWLTAIPPHLHRLPTPQSHTLLLHLIHTFNLTLLKLTTGLSHSTLQLVTSLYSRTNAPFQTFLGHSMACVKVWANALILTGIWLDVDRVRGVVSIMFSCGQPAGTRLITFLPHACGNSAKMEFYCPAVDVPLNVRTFPVWLRARWTPKYSFPSLLDFVPLLSKLAQKNSSELVYLSSQ